MKAMPLLRRPLCVCLACACLVGAAEPITVLYPRAEADDDKRSEYGVALLQLALAKAGGKYRVELSPTRMQQNRAIAEIQSGAGRVDIIGTMTSAERERRLLPVRIPMSRGLIGWRIGLLRADHKDMLREVRSLEDLRRFSAAQGHDWPDLQILRHSGLIVYPVAVYNGLFGMLKAGRMDWVPRSVNEIWAEAARHPELVIDPYIVMHYPTADYYFVNRNNPALAENVRQGLEAALADGSFGQLFYSHYGALIQRARLDQRQVIELPNPLLSPQTPLERKELWFTVDDLKHRR
jgi:ABC-type amino acid transport substrate-binding protein